MSILDTPPSVRTTWLSAGTWARHRGQRAGAELRATSRTWSNNGLQSCKWISVMCMHQVQCVVACTLHCMVVLPAHQSHVIGGCTCVSGTLAQLPSLTLRPIQTLHQTPSRHTSKTYNLIIGSIYEQCFAPARHARLLAPLLRRASLLTPSRLEGRSWVLPKMVLTRPDSKVANKK